MSYIRRDGKDFGNLWVSKDARELLNKIAQKEKKYAYQALEKVLEFYITNHK